MGVYLWVFISEFIAVYRYLWVSVCLRATINIYMGDYGYMIAYGCLWAYMEVYGYL